MTAGTFQFRRGTAAEWTFFNPVLLAGEIGLETDTDQFKVGDGVAVWTARPYGGLVGPAGTTADAATVITANVGPITTVETTVVSRSIPANTLVAGATYKIEAYGLRTSSLNNPYTFRVLFGAVEVARVVGLPSTTAVTNVSAAVEFLVTFRSVGVAGSAIGNGNSSVNQGTTQANQPGTLTPATVNTTVTTDLKLVAVTASVNERITFTNASLRRVT